MSRLTPKTKAALRDRRHRRIRARVKGTADRPRLSIFRSNKFVYAQIIDDEKNVTLANADSKDIKGKTMIEDAKAVGERIAKAGTAKGVTKVVFDRRGFTYSARIKALADAARAGGLKF